MMLLIAHWISLALIVIGGGWLLWESFKDASEQRRKRD